jgi:putative ABC transport system substrate-binding protein
VSYGSNFVSLMRQAASYADRILQRKKPRDLPVQDNLKTAKALGLTVPAPLLARADEVIE